MKHDLFSDINSASDAGFDVIEIWKEKLFKAIAEKSLHDISVELIKNALDPYSINSLEQATLMIILQISLRNLKCSVLLLNNCALK